QRDVVGAGLGRGLPDYVALGAGLAAAGLHLPGRPQEGAVGRDELHVAGLGESAQELPDLRRPRVLRYVINYDAAQVEAPRQVELEGDAQGVLEPDGARSAATGVGEGHGGGALV